MAELPRAVDWGARRRATCTRSRDEHVVSAGKSVASEAGYATGELRVIHVETGIEDGRDDRW